MITGGTREIESRGYGPRADYRYCVRISASVCWRPEIEAEGSGAENRTSTEACASDSSARHSRYFARTSRNALGEDRRAQRRSQFHDLAGPGPRRDSGFHGQKATTHDLAAKWTHGAFASRCAPVSLHAQTAGLRRIRRRTTFLSAAANSVAGTFLHQLDADCFVGATCARTREPLAARVEFDRHT